MHSKHLIAALATTLALGLTATAARAETQDDMSFSGMFKADRIDSNKDGMVSKAEFLAMMTKVWDMKSKEMKAKDDKITMEQMKQILMYMKAGG